MAENPGLEKVENLLDFVHKGSYVIPYFQRGFEWQPTMVCDLLESILQNYYVGPILLWDLKPEEAEEEEWDAVRGAELGSKPKRAILDGQQRLASLYYALHNPKKTFPNRRSYYTFYLDLRKALNGDYEGAVTYRYSMKHQSWAEMKRDSESEWAETALIPLAMLSAQSPTNPSQKYMDSKEFEDWLNGFISKNAASLPEDTTTHRVYQVLNGILYYSFVFFPLDSDRSLPDICNIFARVNAKGMRLSTFDLMNAFLYPKGVRLRVDLWDNLDNEPLKAVESNMNEYLLKLISLFKQNYCSSNYIYNLIPGQKTKRKDEYGKIYEEVFVADGAEFSDLWWKACKYAEQARQIIMNTGREDLGAIKTEFIPNTTLIPVLGAVLWEMEGEPRDPSFWEQVGKWYWSAVISEDYSGSSDTVMAKDFRGWKEWVNSKKPVERLKKITKELIEEVEFQNTKKGSARYNAVMCLLALNDAKDFLKGRIVGTGDYSNERINDHHIFPKKAKGLNAEKCTMYETAKDCVLNRTLLLDETNNKIRNKKPSAYLADLQGALGSEQELRKVLETHLITGKGYEFLKNDDFDNFIAERERAIKQHVMTKAGISPVKLQA